MSFQPDHIGQSVIFECLRDLRTTLGQSANEQAQDIWRHDQGLTTERIVEVLRGANLKRALKQRIARAALPVLLEHRQALLDGYSDARTRAIVAALLTDEVDRPQEEAATPSTSIFENWLTKSHPTQRIDTAIYQLFRRYKPIRSGDPSEDLEWTDDNNHFVICELIFIDIIKRHCWLLTAEGEKYFGSIHVGESDTLFALCQRPVEEKRDAFNHRFLALDLAPQVKHLFSGVMVKIGDTIRKPLAAECLMHKIPTSHSELYEAFQMEVVKSQEASPLPSDSLLLNYTTCPPPTTRFDEQDPQWKRVRRVRDFKILSDLAKRKNELGKAYLREPSRSLAVGEAMGLAKKEWEVFDQREHPASKR
jgi:hypothetical protein